MARRLGEIDRESVHIGSLLAGGEPYESHKFNHLR